jgi:hypothetical protein
VVGAAVVAGAGAVVGAAIVVGATVVVDAAIEGAAVDDVEGGGAVGGGVCGVVGGASVGGGPGGGVVDRSGRVVTGGGAGGELKAHGVVAFVAASGDVVRPTSVDATSAPRAPAVVAVDRVAPSTVVADPRSNPASGWDSSTTASKKALAPTTSSAHPANVATSWPSGRHALGGTWSSSLNSLRNTRRRYPRRPAGNDSILARRRGRLRTQACSRRGRNG